MNVWGGKDNPFEKHISNTQTIWPLIAGDEKSFPALKINILWDIPDFILHLVPTQLQESILSVFCMYFCDLERDGHSCVLFAVYVVSINEQLSLSYF